jgi:hypothetical protein
MSIHRLPSLSLSPHLYSVLVENNEDPSGSLLSTCLDEAKKEDDQMTKNWTEDTSGVLVFVSKISFYFCPTSNPLEDWSFLGHCRGLHRYKSPPTLSRFGQPDGCIAPTTRQHLLRSACCSARHSIQSTSFHCQGQRDVVPQFDPQLVVCTPRNVDAAVGPKISGLCAAPWRAHNEAAYSGVHPRRG